MFACFLKSLDAFRHKTFWFFIVYSIVLSGIILFAVNYVVFSFIGSTTLFSSKWAESISDFIGEGLSVTLTLVTFPILIPIILGFFEDSLIRVTQKQYYSDQNLKLQDGSIAGDIKDEVKFSLKLLLVNLLILPVYLLLPFLNIILYYIVNGYLIGGRYLYIVAKMHLKKENANLFRKKHRFIICICGSILVLGTTLPVINLFVPFFTVIFMVHLFYKLK